jgi:hypothetical protein
MLEVSGPSLGELDHRGRIYFGYADPFLADKIPLGRVYFSVILRPLREAALRPYKLL